VTVLVMDNTAYEKLMEEYKALIHKNQPHREAFASVPHGLHELRAAMTEIDIPDGCALAVVDNHPSQILWQYEGYRRVEREVKL